MKKYGFSFSWKRAIGLSGLKGRISRKIGIPLTESGRERKVGHLIFQFLGNLLAGAFKK
jgi:hypothetical protein